MNNKEEEIFEVVHPLDDVKEEKHTGKNLGLMKLTPMVKFSLMILRCYIILMAILLIYHIFTLARSC